MSAADTQAAAPRVSVIVAARNAAGCLPRLLACLESQTLDRERFEVLVVDDCSTDETPRIVERSPIARLLTTPRRGGAYAARNVGLREARGEVIAITDADCEPAPDWLEAGLAELKRSGAELVGGRIDVPVSDRPTVSELIDLARYLDQERSIERFGYAATANLFVRRRAIERVGAFDDGLISGGDVEFSQRATRHGLELAYSAAPTVAHDPRRRPTELARKSYRVGVGRAQLTIRRKLGSEDQPLMWSRPRFYRPRRGLFGRERVEAAGHLPGPRLRELQLQVGQYLFLQLPMIAGSVAGTLRERRGT